MAETVVTRRLMFLKIGIALLLAMVLVYAAAPLAPALAEGEEETDGQTEGVDPYDLAVKIAAELKYFDLAKKYIDKADVDPPTKALAHARIAREEAMYVTDPEKRDKQLTIVIRMLEAFIQEYPKHERTPDAKLDLGRIYQDKGDNAIRQIEEELDPDRIAELQAEGKVALEKAIELFTGMLEGSKEALTQDPDNEFLKFDNMVARFFLARSYYYIGLLYPPGDQRRIEALKQAARIFRMWLWDYEDTIWFFYVYYYIGKVQIALEKYSKAEMAFATLIKKVTYSEDALRELGLTEMFEWRGRGYVGLCETLIPQEEYEDLHKHVSNFLLIENAKRFDGDYENWSKYVAFALVEEARAYMLEENYAEAEKIASHVANHQRVLYQIKAGEVLVELSRKTSLKLESLLKVANAFRIKGAPEKAVEVYSAFAFAYATLDPKTRQEKAILYMEGMYNMGRAYMSYRSEGQRDSHYYEAMIAYSEVTGTHKWLKQRRDPRANDTYVVGLGGRAADQNYKAAVTRSAASGAAYDSKLLTRRRSELSRGYPDFSRDVEYFGALEKENQRLFVEAAEGYSRVTEKSNYYEKARMKIGYCYYRAFKEALDDAVNKGNLKDERGDLKDLSKKCVTAFKAYLELTGKRPTSSDEARKNRKKYIGQARYYGGMAGYHAAASLAKDQKEKDDSYKNALTFLLNYEKDLSDNKDYLAFAFLHEIRSLVRLKRVDEAETRANAFMFKFPSITEKAVRDVLGRVYYELGDLQPNDKSEKKAKYWSAWLELKPNQPPRNYLAVGNVLVVLATQYTSEGRNAIAREKYRQALALYKQRYELFTPADNEKDVEDMSRRMIKCLYELGQWSELTELVKPLYAKYAAERETIEKELLKHGDDRHLQPAQVAEFRAKLDRAEEVIYEVIVPQIYAYIRAGEGGGADKAKSFKTALMLCDDIPKLGVQPGDPLFLIGTYLRIRALKSDFENGAKDKAKRELKAFSLNWPNLGIGKATFGGKDISDLFRELMKELGIEAGS